MHKELEDNFWTGTRIQLRALELSDAEFFFMLGQDTERTRLLDWLTPPKSMAEVEARLAEKVKQPMQDYGFQWMIDTLDGQTVGSIVTQDCDPKSGTFSYALDVARPFQRQGYATEAIQIVLKYYFEELRFQKVTVCVQSINEASLGLHRQMGFVHEGTHRRMVFSGAAYHDLEWFGMTAEEFQEL